MITNFVRNCKVTSPPVVSATNPGDTGGSALRLNAPDGSVPILDETVPAACYEWVIDVRFGVYAGVEQFSDEHPQQSAVEVGTFEQVEKLLIYWKEFGLNPGLISVEDRLSERGYANSITLTHQSSDIAQMVGDDLSHTNPNGIRAVLDGNLANSLY
jgi:enolase